MEERIVHTFVEEMPEAKARWFRSLPLEARMDILCAYTDLALAVHPDLSRKRNVTSVTGRVQVLTRT
ncbi:MAG: hypothetical protein HYU64_04290 [Armatimonadetes bacterium]|nr:hypothetical protein [Armatimonadota bacterium]